MKTEEVMAFEELRQKVNNSTMHNETVEHMKMKLWVAKKFFSKGCSVYDISFEERFEGNSYFFTLADVFIKTKNTVAYCQCCRNDGVWIRHFIEKCLPILKKKTKKQIVVFPENLEVLYPSRWEYCFNELTENDVTIWLYPFSLPTREYIKFKLSYESIEQLKILKDRLSPNTSLINFIEIDLYKYLKKVNQQRLYPKGEINNICEDCLHAEKRDADFFCHKLYKLNARERKCKNRVLKPNI